MTRPDPDRHPTLATVLGMHGFRTLAIPNDDWAKFPIMLGSTHGFQELVDVDNLPGAREDASNDHVALEEAIGRLRGLGGQRFFLWLHFFAPHYPLRLHPQVPAPSVDAIESRYAHAVEFVDWLMGRLLDAVAATGRSDIAVVFTGDHGEVLRPEQTHGIDTTEDLIRVPLLVGGPGVVPRHVSEVVSLVDLAPTLLAWAGARPPAEMQGVDLRPVLWGGDGPRDRAVVVDTWLHDGAGNPNWDFIAVVTERRKLRWDRRARTLKLTDPVTDPADTHNLRGTEDSSRLLRVLRDYEERSGCLDSLR